MLDTTYIPPIGTVYSVTAPVGGAYGQNRCHSCLAEHNRTLCEMLPFCSSTTRDDNLEVVWLKS